MLVDIFESLSVLLCWLYNFTFTLIHDMKSLLKVFVFVALIVISKITREADVIEIKAPARQTQAVVDYQKQTAMADDIKKERAQTVLN
ncbi:hypothetical protein [Pontibacter beigongshangensis]|uniref:hypothetical protein n=1 Tax=Pontibacter beigongshangensis TaxID=2574733 RepID=UPI00164FA38E|nr:hypothetical protein [Pontibacter beigongshangensis]